MRRKERTAALRRIYKTIVATDGQKDRDTKRERWDNAGRCDAAANNADVTAAIKKYL